MIPEAAVEAAAKRLMDYDDFSKRSALDLSREILEAAAQHMLAGAWGQGHESGFWNGRLSQLTVPYGVPTPDIGVEHANATNPYRSQA